MEMIQVGEYLIAYPDDPDEHEIKGNLKDWNGRIIGRYEILSIRKAVFFGHWSWQGSCYYYYRATLADGRRYSLRGFGPHMAAKGKRIKADH